MISIASALTWAMVASDFLRLLGALSLGVGLVVCFGAELGFPSDPAELSPNVHRRARLTVPGWFWAHALHHRAMPSDGIPKLGCRSPQSWHFFLPLMSVAPEWPFAQFEHHRLRCSAGIPKLGCLLLQSSHIFRPLISMDPSCFLAHMAHHRLRPSVRMP